MPHVIVGSGDDGFANPGLRRQCPQLPSVQPADLWGTHRQSGSGECGESLDRPVSGSRGLDNVDGELTIGQLARQVDRRKSLATERSGSVVRARCSSPAGPNDDDRLVTRRRRRSAAADAPPAPIRCSRNEVSDVRARSALLSPGEDPAPIAGSGASLGAGTVRPDCSANRSSRHGGADRARTERPVRGSTSSVRSDRGCQRQPDTAYPTALPGVTTRWDARATLRLRTGVGVGDVPLAPTAVVSAVDRMGDVLMAGGRSMSLSFGTIGWPRRPEGRRPRGTVDHVATNHRSSDGELSRRDGGRVWSGVVSFLRHPRPHFPWSDSMPPACGGHPGG